MAGTLRVSRSRGALTGVLLVLLGLWGGLIAFVGPYFHLAFTPGTAWTYTAGRLWLELLPGAGTVVGGFILLISRVRPVAVFGAWLAALSGAWFAVGGTLRLLWSPASDVAIGTPIGGTVTRVVAELTYFTGLGVIIVFVAALAIGRLTVVGVRDARYAERRQDVAVPADEVPADRTEPVSVPAARDETGPVPAGMAAADGTPEYVTTADTATTSRTDSAG